MDVGRQDTMNDWEDTKIQDVFKRFDKDDSGDLDTFEMSAAITELMGQAPSTGQV